MRIEYTPCLGTVNVVLVRLLMVMCTMVTLTESYADQCRTMIRHVPPTGPRTRRHESAQVRVPNRSESNKHMEEMLNKINMTSMTMAHKLPRNDFVTLRHKKKGMYLQILEDGTVSATNKFSEFVVLRRMLVVSDIIKKVGTVRLQGVAANKFLCLSKCGMLYGMTDPEGNDDCRLREKMEENSYDTYTSPNQSKKKIYVALAANGCPCLLRVNSSMNSSRENRGPRTPNLGSKSDFVLFIRTPYVGPRVHAKATAIVNKPGAELACPVKCKVPVPRRKEEVKKRHACNRCAKVKNIEQCKKDCKKKHHNHNRTFEKPAVNKGEKKRKSPSTTKPTGRRKEKRIR